MPEKQRLTLIEYAYGQGYTDALHRVAEDMHTQAHAELAKNGHGDARGQAFFETYKVLKQNADAIRADNDSRAPIDE